MLVTIIKDVYVAFPVGSTVEVKHWPQRYVGGPHLTDEHYETNTGYIFYPDEVEPYIATDIEV